MKSRPINLKPWEARAFALGNKTRITRVVKPQPVRKREVELEPGDVIWTGVDLVRLENPRGRNKAAAGLLNARTFQPPLGQPGDEIWGRETWRPVIQHAGTGYSGSYQGVGLVDYRATTPQLLKTKVIYPMGQCPSDWSSITWGKSMPENEWRPSTQMPRWASRTVHTIKSIRVQRVQKTTEADAIAEGIERPIISPTHIDGVPVHPLTGEYRDGFARQFDIDNGIGSWDANPWVWVYELERKVT